MTLSTRSTCPTEPVAIQIAVQNGMTEYLIHKDNRHKRKRLDGSVVTNATYEISFWHGVVSFIVSLFLGFIAGGLTR